MEFKMLHVVYATLSALTIWLANEKIVEVYQVIKHKLTLGYTILSNFLKRKPDHSYSIITIGGELKWSRSKLERLLKSLPIRLNIKYNQVYL